MERPARGYGEGSSVRILAFSDLHRDLEQARRLVERSREADAVIAAGDFANQHRGLEETIGVLREIEAPTVLVPGNNETEDALRAACARWAATTVLHGDAAELDEVLFFGLGAGVPTTPWDWSFDLSDDEAASMLAGCPDGCVLVVHSPPYGHLDGAGYSLGSEAILRAIEEHAPRLAVCGHVHECQGESTTVGSTPLYNLGPRGRVLEV
ncbi:MAG TPA: metallophosphoesterase [Thermoleophilaceae bacterium]|nr:metallophosphoesterase [Thermoleophilaceae bacterium]